MQSQRLTLAVTLLLLVLVVASGMWLWSRLVHSEKRPPGPGSRPVATVTQAATTATPVRPPPGYRLAGVAVGEPDSFAVVEAPNGTHDLYRVGAEVPGLGKILRIEAERIEVETSTGHVELWLAPAATPTPTHTRAPLRRQTSRPHVTRPVARSTPMPKPPPPPARGGTAAESNP